MKTRKLGRSNLEVSTIGLGCMSLGTNEQEAIAILETAIDRGINYLDTADLYDQGLNEEFVGKALKGKRDQVILATKVGNRFERGVSGWSWDPSKKHIMSAVKDSLSRLKTDYIDLYQLHGGTIDDPIDETIEAFEQLKDEGLIREYGISSIRPNVIREYVKRSNIVSVMMQYSLLDRRPEELFPFLEEHQVSVVARGPVAKGILTERTFDNLPDKIKKNGYLNYSAQELRETRIALYEMKQQHTMNELALTYCLSRPTVASVIAGASSLTQLIENIDASQVFLPESFQKQLSTLTKQDLYKDHR
ncbi:oxidoreductase [Alkalihalobacillus alcalophilus ATCC 27647 = CGMCC 1.3604]|uniref:Oxidoreductase n=1 Tax=Alkalihalobacillus alcalophilus ATCC 27647 = CGMCC 1.3604 TaxID=1218173 RepID=A0A094XDG1_ALKAL|nr:aldo/keto reductase [Alkalihalobacillus alcalophilus]KGA96805.1 oxidoreductase [Alkalihalobacillus alcalophilus ATCC 27647 = CGMCC 1.3604]MED1561375.1 aldo/keto reductase [Alkalihalobacillus alcalophilus]THG92408.1 oxidoreductase [Alkalihalobacillus alcalophilus ATCC 27647 = CGMCC 1.3604]